MMAKKLPAQKASKAPKASAPSSPEKTAKVKLYDPKSIPEASNIEFVWAEASTLDDNPKNWRTHPERQMKSLDALMKSVKWAGVLLYNKTTGKLLDGHARKKLVGQGPVPVMMGNWTEEQENQILMSLDPIAAMAETDTQALRRIMEAVDTDAETFEHAQSEDIIEAVEELKATLETQAEYIDMGAPSAFLPAPQDFESFSKAQAEKENSVEDVDLTQVSSSTSGIAALKSYHEIDPKDWGPRGPYGIPYLRLDRLAPAPEKLETWYGPETEVKDDTQYFLPWGVASVRKAKLDGLIVCFYVVDEKFESLWNAPDEFCAKMLNAGVKYVVMPNYSCYHGYDLAYDIWQTYRNNWLARYFQEAGLYVIPDLMLGNLNDHNGEVWKYRFAGIPKKAPCVAVQLQQKGAMKDDPTAAYNQSRKLLMETLKLLQPQALIAYCPPDLPEGFFNGAPKGTRIIKTKTFMSLRSEMLKNRQKTGEYLRG